MFFLEFVKSRIGRYDDFANARIKFSISDFPDKFLGLRESGVARQSDFVEDVVREVRVLAGVLDDRQEVDEHQMRILQDVAHHYLDGLQCPVVVDVLE